MTTGHAMGTSGQRGDIPQRKSRGRQFDERVLVVGEGEKTEPYYFDGLKRRDDVKSRFHVKVVEGPGFSAEDVVLRAIEIKTRDERKGREYRYDKVFCVLDAERPSARPSLDRARKLARENSIELCVSNPSFEIWYLAHFVRTCKSFNDAASVIADALDGYWRTHFKRPYQKRAESNYRRVEELMPTAIRNARSVREKDHGLDKDTADCNSSTDMYSLVQYLLGAK